MTFFIKYSGTEKDYEDAIKKVYLGFDQLRFEKGLIVQGVVDKSIKRTQAKLLHAKVRYTDSPVPSNIGIFRNKIVILSWKTPMTILITSKDLAEQFKKFFESAWGVTKE